MRELDAGTLSRADVAAMIKPAVRWEDVRSEQRAKYAKARKDAEAKKAGR